MFALGPFMMMLTTLSFLIGGLFEKTCQPMIDLTIFSEVSQLFFHALQWGQVVSWHPDRQTDRKTNTHSHTHTQDLPHPPILTYYPLVPTRIKRMCCCLLLTVRGHWRDSWLFVGCPVARRCLRQPQGLRHPAVRSHCHLLLLCLPSFSLPKQTRRKKTNK